MLFTALAEKRKLTSQMSLSFRFWLWSLLTFPANSVGCQESGQMEDPEKRTNQCMEHRLRSMLMKTTSTRRCATCFLYYISVNARFDEIVAVVAGLVVWGREPIPKLYDGGEVFGLIVKLISIFRVFWCGWFSKGRIFFRNICLVSFDSAAPGVRSNQNITG